MSGRLIALGLAAAAALAVFADPVFAGPPDFPAPDDAAVRQIAESMVIGGRPMSVRGFTTDDSVEEVVAFYQEFWSEPPEKGVPAVAYEPEVLAPWHLLTRVEDGYAMTVQVQAIPDAGAYGYLAIGRLPEKGEEGPLPLPPDPPALRSSTVLSNVTSEDSGKTAATAMLNNSKSVTSNINFYRNHYAGWRKDIDQPMGDGKHHALAFTQGREQVIITIQATTQGGTNVIFNQVKHDLL